MAHFSQHTIYIHAEQTWVTQGHLYFLTLTRLVRSSVQQTTGKFIILTSNTLIHLPEISTIHVPQQLSGILCGAATQGQATKGDEVRHQMMLLHVVKHTLE